MAAATTAFGGALLALPVFMYLGHGRRALDRAAVAGDTILGVIWTLFAWAVLGNLLDPAGPSPATNPADGDRQVRLAESHLARRAPLRAQEPAATGAADG